MPSKPQNMCYAAILDAGSSGTRMYIYGWKEWQNTDQSPPQIEELFNKKQKTGIAKLIRKETVNDFVACVILKEEIQTEIQANVGRYLDTLFDYGCTFCAGAGISPVSVPLYFLATAGMRALKITDGHGAFYEALLKCIKSSMAKKNSKFNTKDCGSITGEAEALYGWIAAAPRL